MNHLIRIFFAAFFAFSFAGSSVYADEPKESEKIKNKLSEFAEFFYKNPDEELAKDNLQALLESPHFSSFFKKDRAWINRLGYFFGRVGEQFPPIRNYYMIYFDTNPHEQRLLLLDALRLCGDLEVKHYLEQKKVARDFRSEREPIELALASGIPTELNVLDREVNSQFDVDLLWTEFGVSGNTAVLNPLLAVLERVDVMRTKLEEYLKNPPSRRRRELLSELLEEDLQLELNEAGEKIVSPEDVDVVFGSAIDGERKSKILRRIRRAVFIETKELSHVQLKTYVFKSLERMLPRHAKLLGALAEKIPELHESTRALLTPKLATAYFQTKRFKEATKWYQELTKIRPKDHEVLRKLSLAALRGGDYRLARAALEELKKRDKRRYREVNEEFEFKLMQLLPAQGEATDLKLEELVSACNSLKSYSSEFRFFGPQLNEAVSDRPRSESLYWRFAYEAPNSFSVVYFDAEDIISTRWITIGSELFEMDPKWVRVKDQTEIQNKRSTNSFLTERKWCTLLSSLDSQQMFIGEESSVDFIFLKGFGKNPKGFPETGFKGEQNFELLYWAERSSGLPLRGELTISGKSRKYVDFNVQYQQLFRAHNQRQYISAPEVEESNETKEDEKEPQELIDRI